MMSDFNNFMVIITCISQACPEAQPRGGAWARPPPVSLEDTPRTPRHGRDMSATRDLHVCMHVCMYVCCMQVGVYAGR